jgi:predicted  nucleic acid-binding Zn-ribbon protein
VGQLSTKLEELQTLSEDRLRETEALTEQIVQLRIELELAQEKRGEKSGSSSDVMTTTAYLTLQAQFSIVQQENNQLRSLVEELRTLLYEARAQHFTQLDEIRAEEVKYEGEVREEIAQLEALLATAKREYELLRIEFEKRMAANEQAAPLAK